MRQSAPHPTAALLASLLGAFVVSGLSAPPARASDLDSDTYENRKLGVSFTRPDGWVLARQTGYPSLLAFVSRGSSRIALSFAHLAARQRIIQLVTANNRALDAVGLHVGSSGRIERFGRKVWRVISRTKDRTRVNRQLYVSAGQVVYILTLSCTSAALRKDSADFDFVLESLQARRWETTSENKVRDRGKRRSGAGRGGKPTHRTNLEGLGEMTDGAPRPGASSQPGAPIEGPGTRLEGPRDVVETAKPMRRTVPSKRPPAVKGSPKPAVKGSPKRKPAVKGSSKRKPAVKGSPKQKPAVKGSPKQKPAVKGENTPGP